MDIECIARCILNFSLKYYCTKGRVKKKSWLLTKKGEGGLVKNQLANFIFYFSTNNEYSI